jgi:pyruvate-formate lyase-activating enzyme
VGCISEQDPETGPPPSQWRIAVGPEVEECVRVAVPHLEGAGEGAIVSWGQGCEGEPLLRAEAMAEAIRLIRRKTARGTLHVNTNGSRPDAFPMLAEAGLDSCRISLNAAEPVAYEAYYRPTGYRWSDVARAIVTAKEAGLFVSLNLLVFPGVSDRPEQVEALLELLGRAKADRVQTRNLCIDPQSYLDLLPAPAGEPIGVGALLERLAEEGHRVGNYNVPREEMGAEWPGA